MTIILGAVQDTYAFALADTLAIEDSRKKLFYPQKMLPLEFKDTVNGERAVYGFCGWTHFGEFFKDQMCRGVENREFCKVDDLVQKYSDIRKRFAQGLNGSVKATRDQKSKECSVMIVPYSNALPITHLGPRRRPEFREYHAIGSGASIALEFMNEVAPLKRWRSFSVSTSLVCLLSAYDQSVSTVVGCGGVPVIYYLNSQNITKMSFDTAVLMQRVVMGYHGGAISMKLTHGALEELLSNSLVGSGSVGSSVRGVKQELVMKSPKSKRSKVEDVLDGFLAPNAF